MSTQQMALAKKETVDIVAERIRQFQNSRQIDLPVGYSVENALKSAWLVLQGTTDRSSKPVLEVCTKDSIANSLLDMVVQGLNPAKKQGYFIAYGNKLTFQRSYFGTMAVAMQVDDTIQEIIAEVVYENDVFKYRINRGRKEITEHEQSLESVNGKKIKAAYCMVIDVNGEIKKTEIMTFDEIKRAWAQSQMRPIDEKGNIKDGSTHEKFTAEMCKKTVINRTLKPIINASNDNYLFKTAVSRTDEVVAEETVSAEIAEHANTEAIDITAESVHESEPELQSEQEQEPIDIKPAPQQPKPEQQTLKPTGTGGPSF